MEQFLGTSKRVWQFWSIFALLVFVGIFFFLLRGRNETVQLSPLTLVSTSTRTTTASTTIIIAFGDSVTAGLGLALSEAYPAVLERLLVERGYQVKVLNAGVSGETSAGGLRRAQFIASQKPDLVLLALGGNDVLRGIDPLTTKKNLDGITTILKASGAQIVLIGMYAPQNLGEAYTREFDAVYPALAQKWGIPLIPFLLEGVALKPSLNQNDGIHPNALGARSIAEQNIMPLITPLLTKR